VERASRLVRSRLAGFAVPRDLDLPLLGIGLLAVEQGHVADLAGNLGTGGGRKLAGQSAPLFLVLEKAHLDQLARLEGAPRLLLDGRGHAALADVDEHLEVMAEAAEVGLLVAGEHVSPLSPPEVAAATIIIAASAAAGETGRPRHGAVTMAAVIVHRLLVLAGAFAFTVPVWTSAAGPPVFGPPANLSQTSGHSYLPTVVIENSGPTAGRAWVAWQDFTSTPNLNWCAEDTGSGFGASAVCTPNQTQSWSPRAVTDSKGRTHVAWRDRTGGNDEIFYATGDAVVWTSPVNVSQTPGSSRNPTIAIDPGDNPHVLWEEDSPGTRFFESHFDGAQWSVAQDTGLPFVQAAFLDTIRIACDSAGTLHAVWFDGASSLTEIYHAARPPGGPWGAPENVSMSPNDRSDEPAIAVAPDDTLHVVWVEQDPVTGNSFDIAYSSRAPAGAWTPQVNVSQQYAAAFWPAVAVGADGVARIAWQIDAGLPLDIYFVAAPGGTPINISQSPASASQRAALALDVAGEVLLAWQENTGSNWEIYTASSRSPPILLKAVADAMNGHVVLSWSGGKAPFDVGRSTPPDVASNWSSLTPPGGTPTPTWTDQGVLQDGSSYYYGVR